MNLPLALAIGAVVGFISGMFGVGGSFLLVPLMIMVLKVPMKIAVGTSLLSVIAPAVSGSLSLWFAGKLDLSLLPVLLLGGVIGVQVGVKFLLLIKEQGLKIAFIVLLMTVSAYMLALGFQLI